MEPPGVAPLILVAMEPLKQEWYGNGRVVESQYRVFGIGADFQDHRSFHPISAYNPVNPGGVFKPDTLWAFIQHRS